MPACRAYPSEGAASIDGLFGLNRMLDGTALPRLDEAQIQSCIERDALDLLELD
jgi:hypothetical protein